MLEAIHDAKLMWLFGGVLGLLALSSLVGGILRARNRGDASRSTIDNLNARIRAWWKMCAIFAASILLGRVGSLILFGLISFLAMREYMTLVPTRRGDHRTLFWSFFVIMPLQYFLIGIQWYGFFAIMIPVLAFAFVPTSIAIYGDTEHFLERAAKIQFGIMVCAYCLSYAPALCRSDERRASIRVGQTHRQAQNCLARKPEQDLGRVHWRRFERGGFGHRTVVGDSILTAAIGRNVPDHLLHGLRGWAGDERDQTRHRDQGFWRGHRRPRRNSGPYDERNALQREMGSASWAPRESRAFK